MACNIMTNAIEMFLGFDDMEMIRIGIALETK